MNMPFGLLSYELRFDRKGDKRCFLWKTRLITCPIFIQSCYDSVAIFSYHPVESFLGSSQPVFLFFAASALVRNFISHVEVTVSQWLILAAYIYPIVIHTKSTQYHLLIMTAQIAINREDTLCLQLQEHRVDELYNVIST